MDKSTFEKAYLIDQEIKTLEDEVDFLLNYVRGYKLYTKVKKIFVKVFYIQEEEFKLDLDNTDLRALIKVRTNKIKQLKDQLEQL